MVELARTLVKYFKESHTRKYKGALVHWGEGGGEQYLTRLFWRLNVASVVLFSFIVSSAFHVFIKKKNSSFHLQTINSALKEFDYKAPPRSFK